MPNLYFAPPARQDPYAFANRDAMMQIFDVINKSKKESFETQLLERYFEDPEQGFKSLMAQEEPEGFFGRMWDVVNPKGTYRGGMGGLSPFTQHVLSRGMGIGDVGKIPYAVTLMDKEQKQKWLDNYGQGVTIQTGERLLTPEQRRERAETEFREKVGLSTAEKSLARKSAEDLLKGTKGRWWAYGWADYSQEMMLENYKSWRAENSLDEQTPRKQKELDDLWDAKMALWQKSGIKFDRDNIISKNEIVWDTDDPEVKKLRGGTPTGMQQLPPTGKMSPSTLPATESMETTDLRGLGTVSSESRKQASNRLTQIYESLDPQIKGPFLTAWNKASKAGVTEEEFLAEWLKR